MIIFSISKIYLLKIEFMVIKKRKEQQQLIHL